MEIPLTKGLWATVSECDYSDVIEYKWYADVTKWTTYAKTDQMPDRPRLHVFIMQPPLGYIVHHKDKNGLNCTRENLEVILQSEHSRFSALRSNKKGSKYRGVYFHKQRRKFTAEIWINYKKHYLGLFNTEEEAALAYNRAGLQLLGEGRFELNIIQDK